MRSVGAFIGRARELDQLRAWLDAGPCVVVVHGAAGVGKSRLVEACLRDGRRAVVRCDLARAVDEPGLVSELCHALDVRAPSRRPNREERLLARAAESREGFTLWLDDADGHADTLRERLLRWRVAAPSLRVIVTLRGAFSTPGARTLELQPLSLPGEGEVCESVRLLAALCPPPAPSEEALAPLAVALDGLPLALELAAARLPVFGVEGLLARLPERLDVLRAEGSEPARHRSLHAALDVSWAHLSPDERTALARCAVFEGAFDLDAAEAVLGPKASRSLDALRAQSWVRGAAPTLSLLTVVRAYVLEHLRARGDAAEALRLHAEHYVARGERRVGPLDDGVRSNLRGVARRSEHPDADRESLARSLRAALALDASERNLQGPEARALAWSKRVEVASAAGLDASLRGRARLCLAEALQLLGRVEEARRALRDAVALARGDAAQTVSALTSLGVLEHRVRALDTARGCYEEALAVAVRAGDRVAEGRCLGNLGALAHDAGDADGARGHYRRALPIFRAANEARLEGVFLCNIALLDQEEGRFDEARERLSRAVALLEGVRDARLVGIALGNLGAVEHEAGDLARAEAAQRRALAAQRQSGDLVSELLATLRLVALCATTSRDAEAHDLLARATVIADGLEDPHAEGLVSLARAFTERASPAAVRARIEAARAPHRETSRALAETSDDARWMLRLLAKEPSAATVLSVSRAQRRFRLGEGPWVELARFGTLWRIFEALVDAHARDREAVVSADALLAAGWPEQRMLPEAATNRLHVALSTLRTRGARAALARIGEGYRLAPELTLREVDREAPA